VVICLTTRGAGTRFPNKISQYLYDNGNLSGVIFSNQAKEKVVSPEWEVPSLGLNTYETLIGFVLRVARFQKITKEINSFIAAANPAIVIMPMQHSLDFFVIRSLRKLRSNQNFKLVIFVHDGVNHPGDSKLLNNSMIKPALRCADFIVTLSQTVTTRIKHKTRAKLIELSHPVELVSKLTNDDGSLSPIHPNYKTNYNPVFIFYGRLIKYKGIQRLSESWKIFCRKWPGAHLVIAGEGDRELVTEYFRNAKNCKIIFGYLNYRDLDSLIAESDFILLPYDEASQSGIIAEAVSFQKPYIITPIQGLLEQSNLCGGATIAEDMSPEAFAGSMETSMLNPPRFNPNNSLLWSSQMELLYRHLHE
jgi:glycosyltransferase involved in cell wall biosynthesis